MSEEQLKELQEYNLEYLEAQQSEEIFGGDYTSSVELKYAKKEIERLNNKNEELLTLYTTERNVKEDYKAIIKEVREELKIIKELDDFNVVKLQLTNIIFRLDKEVN